MKQYLELLRDVRERGTYKAPARENMPGTRSLFGYQLRHNLQDGFPLLTTKKINFKHIVTELLWFMRGDTNIRYLIDNGCNIWNQDAYNFYLKQIGKDKDGNMHLIPMSFKGFIERVKCDNCMESRVEIDNGYKLGDCGVQYGQLWRSLKGVTESSSRKGKFVYIDQFKDLIDGLKANPMSRRHIIDAWNPATLNDMALNACHALVQFNCRPLGTIERARIEGIASDTYVDICIAHGGEFQGSNNESIMQKYFDDLGTTKYALDCQMYQRSADSFLGVPYNIASYALLTHILAKMVGMIPGEFIHTFGDVHIYDNHKEQTDLQLLREPTELPNLVIHKTNKFFEDLDVSNISHIDIEDFDLENYNPQSRIKGKLSTGMK